MVKLHRDSTTIQASAQTLPLALANNQYTSIASPVDPTTAYSVTSWVGIKTATTITVYSAHLTTAGPAGRNLSFSVFNVS